MAVSANETSGRRLSAIPSGQYASYGGNGPTGTFITIPSYSFRSICVVSSSIEQKSDLYYYTIYFMAYFVLKIFYCKK